MGEFEVIVGAGTLRAEDLDTVTTGIEYAIEIDSAGPKRRLGRPET